MRELASHLKVRVCSARPSQSLSARAHLADALVSHCPRLARRASLARDNSQCWGVEDSGLLGAPTSYFRLAESRAVVGREDAVAGHSLVLRCTCRGDKTKVVRAGDASQPGTCGDSQNVWGRERSCRKENATTAYRRCTEALGWQALAPQLMCGHCGVHDGTEHASRVESSYVAGALTKP